MNRSTAELEDQIRAVFAAQARGIDERAAQSPLGSGDSVVWDALPPTDSTEPILLLDPSRTVRRPPQSRTVLTIAAALVVAAAGMAAVSRVGGHGAEPARPATDTIEPALVLAGETVLATDPLVVQAALGQEPTFDVSGLGTELRFDPLTSLDDPAVRDRLDNLAAEVEALRSQEPDAAGLTIAKVTVSGWVDDKLWLTTVADRPAPSADRAADPSAAVRRYSWTSFEDGSTVFETPGSTVDGNSTDGIALPETAADPFGEGGGVAGVFPTGPIFVNHLPTSVAVVSYADADQQYWMRPRGGVAAFRAVLQRSETYTIRAYAADGTVLGEESGDNTAANAPLVYRADPGDQWLPLPAEDAQGQPVDLGARDRPLILVYGASWCTPCQNGIAEATAALDALGDTVYVYAVLNWADAADAWPQLDTWRHPRIRVTVNAVETRHRDEVATPLDIVGVPAVLVVGADGLVLGMFGFEDLAGELAGVGLSPPPPSAD